MNEINHCQKPDYRPPHLTPLPLHPPPPVLSLSPGVRTPSLRTATISPTGRTGRATGPGSLIPPGAFSSARPSGRSARARGAHTPCGHPPDRPPTIPLPEGTRQSARVTRPARPLHRGRGRENFGTFDVSRKNCHYDPCRMFNSIFRRFLGGRKRRIQVGTRVGANFLGL